MPRRSTHTRSGPRGIGGLRATYATWTSNAYRFAPVVGPVLLWIWLSGTLFASAPGGPIAALALTAATLATALYLSWRHRLRTMGKTTRGFYLPFWTHVAHLVRVWRLFCFWARAVASLRMTQVQRGPTVLPPPRPLRRAEGVWWFVDGDGTIRGRVKHGPYGITSEALSTNAAALSEYLGAYEVGVRNLRHPARHHGKVLGDLAAAWGTVSGSSEIRVYYVDSIGRMMHLRELPAAPQGKVAFGRHADRSPAYVDAGLSTFISGMTGAGKSNILWTLLADLRRSNTPVRLYVSDPKGGMELSVLGEQVGKSTDDMFEVRQYAKSAAETTAMIKSMHAGMVKRQQAQAGRKQRKHTPTTAEPLAILVCDEFLALEKEARGGADTDLGRLLYQGRAVGYITIALVQDPTKATSGDLRDMFPQRIALKLPSPSSSVPALGIAAPCHHISEPGVGYVFKDGETEAQRFRAPYVRDEDVERIARGEVLDMPGDEIGGEPTTLYRHYGRPTPDAEEVLLYIGITNDYAKRTQQHRDTKAWWDQVTRSTTETWPSRNKALIEEAKAIKAEAPVYNVEHNVGNPLRRPNAKRPMSDPRRQAEVRRWGGTTTRRDTKRKAAL